MIYIICILFALYEPCAMPDIENSTTSQGGGGVVWVSDSPLTAAAIAGSMAHMDGTPCA